MERIEKPDSAHPVDYISEKKDVAEEDARDHNQWGNHAHDGAIGDLLQRVELSIFSGNEGVFTSLEYTNEVVECLLPQDWQIRRPHHVMGPEAAAGEDIDTPEDEGEGHRITDILMDRYG